MDERRAPADREASIKDSGFTGPGSGVTVLCPVREWLAGTGSGGCWAETNQCKSRERFPVLYVLNEHDQEL